MHGDCDPLNSIRSFNLLQCTCQLKMSHLQIAGWKSPDTPSSDNVLAFRKPQHPVSKILSICFARTSVAKLR